MADSGGGVDVALAAVLVSSSHTGAAAEMLGEAVCGPGEFGSLHAVLSRYATTGFQASHFGHAMHIARAALPRQPRSRHYAVRDGEFVEVPSMHESAKAEVRPVWFLGVTAQLMGTGCREAIQFLVREGLEPLPSTAKESDRVDTEDQKFGFELFDSVGLRDLRSEPLPDDLRLCFSLGVEPRSHHSFLSAIVVSGGGIEHDIRRACTAYRLSSYASDASESTQGTPASVCFGNVTYPVDQRQDLFSRVMRIAIRRLKERQARLQQQDAATPIPSDPYFDQCTWNSTPSEVWAWIGLHLPLLFAEAMASKEGSFATTEAKHKRMTSAAVVEEAFQRARSTVVYWAAQQGVPIFSPSFTDGDVMDFLLETSSDSTLPPLAVDLVRDIHSLNKMAMTAGKTAVLICGGGVVKHHICNANLMRNGSDYTIFLNSGQEFDGSDAGAKPEEALSWGKIRFDGEHVKVCGEVTAVLPLLVGEVFVDAVRHRRANSTKHEK